MVSIWPTVGITSENYAEIVRRSLLIKVEKGIPILQMFRGLTRYVDFTNPEAKKFI
jgi:alpha-D-xyloside xylohydrolase